MPRSIGASRLAPQGIAAAELGSHSPPNIVGATTGRPRACNARPYGVVRFSTYSVGERLGAPAFNQSPFFGRSKPLPYGQAQSVRITERSGVGATTGRPRACNARPYGVVRFSTYSVGERLGAPAFNQSPFFGRSKPLPYGKAESVRITERSGVTLVPAPNFPQTLAISPIL